MEPEKTQNKINTYYKVFDLEGQKFSIFCKSLEIRVTSKAVMHFKLILAIYFVHLNIYIYKQRYTI